MFRTVICSVGLLLCLLGLTACAPADADVRPDNTMSVATAAPSPTPTPNPWEGASFAPDGTLMSHSSITHTAEVVEKEGVLPYVLYTPSTAATEEKYL